MMVANSAIAELFAASSAAFATTMEAIEAVAADLEAIGESPPPQPRWDQDWFPRLDAALAYALVRRHTPRRVVEVGSGHSTRFLARAVLDGGLETTITAIDPAPRARLEGLPVELVPITVQDAGADVFAGLAEGDMVVIDSSHVFTPGSDMEFILDRILPNLSAGVLIHFHDIFLPWDYPEDWAWRGYTEQKAVSALLMGGGYDVVFASRYALATMNEGVMGSVIGRLPLVEGAYESSLWLRDSRGYL